MYVRTEGWVDLLVDGYLQKLFVGEDETARSGALHCNYKVFCNNHVRYNFIFMREIKCLH
jgi:hypothetical protein